MPSPYKAYTIKSNLNFLINIKLYRLYYYFRYPAINHLYSILECSNYNNYIKAQIKALIKNCYYY